MALMAKAHWAAESLRPCWAVLNLLNRLLGCSMEGVGVVWEGKDPQADTSVSLVGSKEVLLCLALCGGRAPFLTAATVSSLASLPIPFPASCICQAHGCLPCS